MKNIIIPFLIALAVIFAAFIFHWDINALALFAILFYVIYKVLKDLFGLSP